MKNYLEERSRFFDAEYMMASGEINEEKKNYEMASSDYFGASLCYEELHRNSNATLDFRRAVQALLKSIQAHPLSDELTALDQYRRLVDKANELVKETKLIDDRRLLVLCLMNWGHLCLEVGDYEQAFSIYIEARKHCLTNLKQTFQIEDLDTLDDIYSCISKTIPAITGPISESDWIFREFLVSTRLSQLDPSIRRFEELIECICHLSASYKKQQESQLEQLYQLKANEVSEFLAQASNSDLEDTDGALLDNMPDELKSLFF